MTMQDRIDPEVRAPLDGLLGAFPGGFNAIPDIVARRELVAAVLARAPKRVAVIGIGFKPGAPDVRDSAPVRLVLALLAFPRL